MAASPLTRENDLEKKLVWIFGSPRSGTSWLAMQLLSYRTYCMNEPFIGRHIGHIAFEITDRVVRDLELSRSRNDYFFSKEYAPAWQFLLRKFILGRIYAQFHDFRSKKAIIIKEPNGSIASDIISTCLPKSKIIALIRDGRDVIDSQIDAIQDGSWGLRWSSALSPEERPSFIARQAKMWDAVMKTVERAYKIHDEQKRLMIKYEDLRRNTYDLTNDLYQFTGIPITDDKLRLIVNRYKFENLPASRKGRGKVKRAAQPGMWRKSFTDAEKDEMWKIMGKTLQRLGYTKDGDEYS